ncbi:hypothetical protein SCUCBS95973_002315 [Sporothrix curviconia]|uniref:NAD(P)-binding protein n=1 Tax=Sporothrix curviconia TaxID=1260050 RepID=A0ABP0B6M6_9PEZI
MAKFTAASLPSLRGKIYLVTGGNAGIGKATVTALASHGARVYMGARSVQKAEAAIKDIKAVASDADIRILQLDLNNLSSVVAAAKKFKASETELHGLINNAGVMGTEFSMTADGFESQFQVSAITPTQGAVRIVNVSSAGHNIFTLKEGVRLEDTSLKAEGSMTRYGQSKLANILHSKQLNQLYGTKRDVKAHPAEIWTASVHPGTVSTELLNKASGAGPHMVRQVATNVGSFLGLFVNEATGALSSLWAAASPDFQRKDSGGYAVPPGKIGTSSAKSNDMDLAARLWAWTEKALGDKGFL